MNEFDERIRQALHRSLADCAVPTPPGLVRQPVVIRRRAAIRWIPAIGVALVLTLLTITAPGRFALAQLQNAIGQTVSFFGIAANGEWYPIENVSLSLDEALQTQAFHVVAPGGLPPRAELQSIQRLGSGPSTTVIFDYVYGGKTFSIIETPARSSPTADIVYSVKPIASKTNDRFISSPGKPFRFQAREWVSGSARVALFAENALTSSEVTRIEQTMAGP